MSDDLFADMQDDLFADLRQTQPQRRGNMFTRVVPETVRDVTRSVLSLPVDVARLSGVLGNQTLGTWGEGANNWLNRNVSQEARFDEEPLRAALQIGGAALVPIPGAGFMLRAASRGPLTAAAARAAELAVIPGSAPYTLGNVAANAGVGVALGAGIEELFDEAERDKAKREGRPVPGVAEPDLFADMQPPRTWAERMADAVPYIAAGLGVTAVGAAARSAARMQSTANAANIGGLTRPGTPLDFTPTSGVVEALEASVANSNQIITNRLNEGVKRGNFTRDEADTADGIIRTHTSEAINNDRSANIFDTGYAGYGIRIEPPRVLAEDIARLSDDKRSLFNNALSAADELDVRTENVRQGKVDASGNAVRNALSDKDDTTLVSLERLGKADPEVNAFIKRYRAINDGLLELAVKQGVFSASEAAQMRKLGPNYLHRVVYNQNIERNVSANMPLVQGTERNSPLTKRNRAEDGGPDHYQDPIMAMQDGIRQTMDFIYRNNAIKAVALYLGDWQKSGTPYKAARNYTGIGRVLPDIAGRRNVADGMIPVKFRDGGRRFVLEVDPTISAGLLPYPRAAIPVLNGSRMWWQKLTTGPIGFLAGNMQAPVSALMGGFGAMINAPAKMRVGYLDSLIKQMSGGKVNLRTIGVADPTFVAQMGVAFIKTAMDATKYALSMSLDRSVKNNGVMVGIIGKTKARDAADKMMQAYLRSDLHRMEELGLHARGLSYAAETPDMPGFAAALSNLSQHAPDYAARMAYDGFGKSITDVRSMQQLNEWAAVKSAGFGGQRGIVQMRRAYHGYAKLLDLLANSPQSALYMANKKQYSKNEFALVGHARSVTGDPAQYGGSKYVQYLLSAIPFGNITMQATHQAYRAFRREPYAASARTAFLATMTGVITIQSAINADEWAIENGEQPAAVAHMLTSDSRDAASSFRYYFPGVDPEQAIRLPIEQSFAPAFAMARAGLMEAFGVDDPRFFAGRYANLRYSIHKLIDDNASRGMRAAMGIAGADIAMNPAIDFATRVGLSHQVDDALSLATGARIRELQDADGFDRRMANNDVVDRYTAIALETIAGFTGSAVLDLARTFGLASRGGETTMQALASVGEQYSLNLGGGARIAAPLMFGQERRLRSSDLIGEEVREVEQKLQTINRNFSEVIGGSNTIGNQRTLRESAIGGGRMGVAEDMAPVLGTLNSLYNSTRSLRNARAEISRSIREMSMSPQLRANPTDMRARINEKAAELRELNATLYDAIADAERQLSRATGRSVRVRELDPTRGLDQFPFL